MELENDTALLAAAVVAFNGGLVGDDGGRFQKHYGMSSLRA